MILIGLTGGIGSGKSAVGRLLADRGAVVIDADAIAREVVEPGSPALAAIGDRFGAGVVRPDGTLDRAGLAQIVFRDPIALRDLEAITHPAIRERTAARIVRAREDGAAVVVHEMPILVETGSRDMYDLVVVVDAPEQVRLDRAVARGMDPDDVRRRMTAQVGRDELLAVADIVIDNSGDLDALAGQVERLWHDTLAAGA